MIEPINPSTPTVGPYRDGDPTQRRFDAVEAEARRLAGRVENLERERFRWREVVRSAAGTARSATAILFAASVLYGLLRLCFLGSAWGEHARRLAEREAVTYVRAITPNARVVLATCRPRPAQLDSWDMLCIVTVDGVRTPELWCDDDEPGHNDGCVAVPRNAGEGQ